MAILRSASSATLDPRVQFHSWHGGRFGGTIDQKTNLCRTSFGSVASVTLIFHGSVTLRHHERRVLPEGSDGSFR